MITMDDDAQRMEGQMEGRAAWQASLTEPCARGNGGRGPCPRVVEKAKLMVY